MTEEEYSEALTEKARILYCRLIGDPLPVPMIESRNKEYYSSGIRTKTQMDYWKEIIEQVQIIKRGDV